MDLIDNVTAAEHRIRGREQARENAIHTAVGYSDDARGDGHPPTLVIVVKHRRIVRFDVADSLVEHYRGRECSGENIAFELSVYISTHIRAAFDDWATDYAVRIEQAG